jgi:very-short-patch-repair endonuclease
MRRSLEQYLRENFLREDERIALVIDEIEAEGDDDFVQPHPLWSPLYRRVFAAQAYEVAENRLERCRQTVDENSPPEDAMFLALVLVGGEKFKTVFFATDPPPTEPNSEWDSWLIIEPQSQIGGHRVDFVLTLSTIEPFLEDALYPPAIAAHADAQGRISERVVVEVDGHDFHDRTKEQASRDRRRDRTLQGRNLPVLRFTGSDIWRDPFGCADEALEFLRLKALSAGDPPR